MKAFKNLSILFVFLLLVSCNSDDDGGTTNDVFTPTITLDASTAITRPSGSDITDLIDFGQGAGIPASDYTVELDINDRLHNLGNHQVYQVILHFGTQEWTSLKKTLRTQVNLIFL